MLWWSVSRLHRIVCDWPARFSSILPEVWSWLLSFLSNLCFLSALRLFRPTPFSADSWLPPPSLCFWEIHFVFGNIRRRLCENVRRFSYFSSSKRSRWCAISVGDPVPPVSFSPNPWMILNRHKRYPQPFHRGLSSLWDFPLPAPSMFRYSCDDAYWYWWKPSWNAPIALHVTHAIPVRFRAIAGKVSVADGRPRRRPFHPSVSRRLHKALFSFPDFFWNRSRGVGYWS